ncbi:MAG: chemotaxis protein CheC [Fimbriimonadaceae bacterium]|nr:chemotaxis protein CheC [Fimbriimonadaceae bacterium]
MTGEQGTYGLLEMSAVREMANIGLGHATTALSDLTGRSFNMEVPNVETVAIENVPALVGDPEAVVVGIMMPIEGDVTGHIAFVFPWESAQTVWRYLLGTCPDSFAEVDDLAASAMLEIGNILNSSFMNALSNMTGLAIHATPPVVSIDLCYSVVSTVVAEAELQEVVALAIETKIYDYEDTATQGYFLCIPTVEGLNLMLRRLGVAEAA